MIVVSFGVPKSGSTLAFEMTRAILELNGFAQDRLAVGLVVPEADINHQRDWSDDLMTRLFDATRGTKVVIKTHETPSAMSPALLVEALEAGDLKIHVVYRDPRDAIVSMIDQGVKVRQGGPLIQRSIRGVDEAIVRLGRPLVYLRQWGSFPSLKLQYEKFAFDADAGPRLIADDLGMTADPAEVWERVNRRFTQKNVARPQRHATELWPHEAARIERAFPLFLDLVGGQPCAGWYSRDA